MRNHWYGGLSASARIKKRVASIRRITDLSMRDNVGALVTLFEGQFKYESDQ